MMKMNAISHDKDLSTCSNGCQHKESAPRLVLLTVLSYISRKTSLVNQALNLTVASNTHTN